MFYTIGHSNRTIKEFIELLDEYRIELIVDVRKLPGSNRYPQFNEDALKNSLPTVGIEFIRSEGLTGRRPANPDIPKNVNGWWENQSFHNYADHALSAEFQTALQDLIASTKTLAIMCSEAVWWRCHRRIITDYLLASKHSVTHILGKNQSQIAELSSGARIQADQTVIYPALSS